MDEYLYSLDLQHCDHFIEFWHERFDRARLKSPIVLRTIQPRWYRVSGRVKG
jgi:hypothetical protein